MSSIFRSQQNIIDSDLANLIIQTFQAVLDTTDVNISNELFLEIESLIVQIQECY